MAGRFFVHLQGGYEAPASDGLSFGAEIFSFLGENLVFFMFLLIKPKKNHKNFDLASEVLSFKEIF